MLERLKKAHKKGLFDQFDQIDKLSVPIIVINSYLKILKPAYLFNIYLQKIRLVSLGVIPSILKKFNNWEVLLQDASVSTLCRAFCKFLIEEFKRRFNYELESELYQVIF